MKQDRELIELAAKAVALPECGWMADTFTYVKDNTFTSWEPLTDDGDNRRLQVKLNVGLVPLEGGGWDCIRYDADGEEFTLASDFDPNRCVVRAAAAIGEQMP